MKKLLTFILIVFVVSLTAQSYEITSSFSSKVRDINTREWGEWTKLQDYNIVIIFDTGYIFLENDKKERLRIIGKHISYTNSDGDYVVEMNAIDCEGFRLKIYLMVRNEGNTQMYLQYEYYTVMYNIKI
jgi:hypothetical protein